MSESDSDSFVQKRRPRTISTLTEQQLKQKRDVDRRAQRALRMRTKSRIQELEASYEQLKVAKSDGEHTLRKEVEILQQQNNELRAKLRSIGLFVTQGVSLHEDSTISLEANHDEDVVGSSHSGEDVQGDDVDRAQVEDTDHTTAEFMQANCYSTQPDASNSEQNGSLIHIDNLPDITGGTTESFIHESPIQPIASVFHPEAHAISSMSPPKVPYSDTYRSHAHSRDEYLDGASSHSVARDTSSLSTLSPESSTTPHAPVYHRFTKNSTEVSSFLSRHLPATCPLDQILLDFLSSRRALAASGNPIETLLGPTQPFVAAILHPELATTAHPVSRVMAEVLSTFPKVGLPEKIAFMYLMHGTMKWQMLPTKENYHKLPQWLRPTASQIATPHAAWLDNIPWPRVRDYLVEDPVKYHFENFSEVYSQHVTVNWPFEAMDAVLPAPNGAKSEVTLNPLFEKHIRRLSNWTVSRHFEMVFPELVNAIYARE